MSRFFDRSMIALCAIAAGSGLAVTWIKGPETAVDVLAADLDILIFIVPNLAAAFLLSAYLQLLLTRRVVARMVGRDGSVRGQAVAVVAGAAMPGGPMTSFPLVRTLADAGVGVRTLVTYLTSWSTMGLQRILTWELPLMGPEFALLRFLVSIPLAPLAGLLSYYTGGRRRGGPGSGADRPDPT